MLYLAVRATVNRQIQLKCSAPAYLEQTRRSPALIATAGFRMDVRQMCWELCFSEGECPQISGPCQSIVAPTGQSDKDKRLYRTFGLLRPQNTM